MGLRRTVEPTSLVLSVDDAKTQARIDHSADDGYVTSLIKRATAWCENVTHRQFITATWEWTLDDFIPVFYVPRPRLISVTSIQYVDNNGDTQTVSSSDYRLDIKREPGRITEAYNTSWPTTRTVTNAVTITYTAGYGSSSASVPDDIKHAVSMLISHWYENREAVLVGPGSKEVEFSVMCLLSPHVVPQYA